MLEITSDVQYMHLNILYNFSVCMCLIYVRQVNNEENFLTMV